MNQGDPLLPTIFNVVVYTVVCHWESLMVDEREKRDGGKSSDDKGDKAQTAGSTIRDRDDGNQWAEEGYQRLTVKAVFFNANDGVVASTDPGWI